MNNYYNPKTVWEKVLEFKNTNWLNIISFCNMVGISRPTYYKITRWQSWYIKKEIINKFKKYKII